MATAASMARPEGVRRLAHVRGGDGRRRHLSLHSVRVSRLSPAAPGRHSYWQPAPTHAPCGPLPGGVCPAGAVAVHDADTHPLQPAAHPDEQPHRLGFPGDPFPGVFIKVFSLYQGEGNISIEAGICYQVDLLLAALAEFILDLIAVVDEGGRLSGNGFGVGRFDERGSTFIAELLALRIGIPALGTHNVGTQ